MLTLLYGEDRYSSFERLMTLVTDDRRAQRVEWFEGELLKPPFEALLSTRGLFGPRRVVIHDLSVLKNPGQAFITALIASQDEFIVRERRALTQRALKAYEQATVEVFPQLSGERLLKRLKTLCESFGRDPTPAELKKLATDSKGDLFAAVSQLLSSEAAGAASPDRSLIFRFLRALIEQEAGCIAHLRKLRLSGASDQYLLTMIAWQLKQLLLIVTGEASAVADWQRRALQPALRFWSEERLRAEYFRLVKFDHDLKSGQLPETLGLDYLVLRLLQPTATLA